MGDAEWALMVKMMPRIRPPKFTDRWWVSERVLTSKECDHIIRHSFSTRIGKGNPLAADRDVCVVNSPHVAKVEAAARKMNEERWNLLLKDEGHRTYTARYGVGHCIQWHQEHHLCKLSTTVQLSDPDDYEGGSLDLMVPGQTDSLQTITMPRGRGTVIVFPAWTLHRVTEVTEGERWSLVWMGMGPPLG